MPKYHVEEMDGDAVTASHVVNAKTPLRVAQEATERSVTLRTNEAVWMRVIEEKRAYIFEYAFSL